jgi:hypothetical protein
MSTIYTFHEECAALGAAPAADDELLLYDTSAGVTKNVTASFLRESARSVASGTTAASLNAYGVTLLQTTLGAFTLSDPTQAGQETVILFPTSTGIKTITTAGATIAGSTLGTAGAATVITFTGTSDAPSGSIRLTASSTAKWYITGGTFAKTTLGAPLYITTS